MTNFEHTCSNLGVLYSLKNEDVNLYEKISEIFDREKPKIAKLEENKEANAV